MWRTRAATAKGVSRGGLFVARRYFGIVTPRRTRTRRGVASTRGRARRTRCVLPRVDSAGSRDRAASHPALDRSNLKIDPPRDPFADPRDASLVGARGRIPRRSTLLRGRQKSKKNKKNIGRKKLPTVSFGCAHAGPWKYCGGGFPSSRCVPAQVHGLAASPRGASRAS